MSLPHDYRPDLWLAAAGPSSQHLEELIRNYLSLIDLEEYKLRELSPESETAG